ncbi:hypothetical protein HZS38_07790 [Xenorhabdus nematophila]|uniref:hypothetical protein n=1 Tax=Xenorhabdus nematophila TaxID=628 RepID=UPI00032752C5|nr:hypothetical protein [Xenorhabdus nematophila]CEE95050.1 hypothetical protein XNA1_4910005 [Xenorhabdus nematophila str. Anatoliense]CEF30103.1 hypothetical protein XNW1_2240013 [Xenorhabdus nematophila str. Websteri]AYA40382.1 hypothetical protein D3790_07900 [Xenorhabdus nematophila]KHD27513.1 hypothetical protein LH67_17590 [Xenorhabdus nematophila]MBA0019057.1 hypothetical protein [Xenorhabdus nematophila]
MNTENNKVQGSIQSISGYWNVGATLFIPADIRGQVITIVRGNGLSAPQQAIAVPLMSGISEQKLSGHDWIWLKYSFSHDSTTIEIAAGSGANFTQLVYRA